jgi:hypothetical protein
MSETEVQTTTEEDTDNDPIYYKPGWLSLIASIASWSSWLVFAVYIINTIVQGVWIQSQISGQGLVLSEMFSDPSFLSYIFTNLLLPFFTGIVYFLVLQGVSVGLNVVLEMDFNMREK